MVYEVLSSRGCDQGRSYALKRFFLRSSEAVKRVLHEHRILTRLASNHVESHFVECLFYSFLAIEALPVLVVSKGSGVDLFDLMSLHQPLLVKDASFYCSEIISGLQRLHALGIVHLDLKPQNILLSNSGHAMITDFDCAYDTSQARGPPRPEDYKGTTYYMPPEIFNRQCISYAADIWGVGVVMACLISSAGDCRPRVTRQHSLHEYVRDGRWEVERFHKLTNDVQAFFISCLAFNPHDRPSVESIKGLPIFRDVVNWDGDALLRRAPPYEVGALLGVVEASKFPFDTRDEEFVGTIAWENQPRHIANGCLCTSGRNEHELAQAALTPHKIRQLFANFNFINDRALQTMRLD